MKIEAIITNKDHLETPVVAGNANDRSLVFNTSEAENIFPQNARYN